MFALVTLGGCQLAALQGNAITQDRLFTIGACRVQSKQPQEKHSSITDMQRSLNPACKAAHVSNAAHARIAGLTHDNALLAVKFNMQKAPESMEAA
jgi:hypothetical protein